VANLLLTHQASAELGALPLFRQEDVRDSLARLATGDICGTKLWGQDDVFTIETLRGGRFLYRFSGNDIQVLCIDSPQSTSAPQTRLKLAAVVLAGGYNPDIRTVSLKAIAGSFIAAGIDDIVIVTHDRCDNISQEFKYHNITLVASAEDDDCLSHSLRRGLRLLTPNTKAVLLSLGNRPFVTPGIVTSIIRAFKTRAAPIVVPAYDKMRGHPVLFDACLLPELMRTRGNIGGRRVLERHSKDLARVEIPDTRTLERVWTN